jgi:hypothetical protein
MQNELKDRIAELEAEISRLTELLKPVNITVEYKNQDNEKGIHTYTRYDGIPDPKYYISKALLDSPDMVHAVTAAIKDDDLTMYEARQYAKAAISAIKGMAV